jgi:thermostable 8-oxoguanine DNA glycosylase
MITPSLITLYNRNQDELEEFLLFSILVAGKKASTTAQKLDSFLRPRFTHNLSPFDYVDYLDKKNILTACMKAHKLGQYNRISHAFREVLQFKGMLKNITPYDLEEVKGIGFKTSRFFVVHSQPYQQFAILDTHLLRWLRDHGVDAPKSTPPKKKYFELEKKFLKYASDYGLPPAELDLIIWKQYSNTK